MPYHILLVDDEFHKEEMKIVVRLLEIEDGFTVTLADGTDAALKLIADPTNKFDVLVTDYLMPPKNGTELITKVLEMKPMPFILWSGGNMDEGGDLYWLKRFAQERGGLAISKVKQRVTVLILQIPRATDRMERHLKRKE